MNSSSANIIDGKAFSRNLRDQLATQVTQLKIAHNLTPGLAVVLVGEDPASHVYVRNKEKQALEAGLNSVVHRLDEDTPHNVVLELVRSLNSSPNIHGILVQLPLPSHVNESEILNAIDPKKDVDGFHPINAGQLSIGGPGNVPCTPLGSIMLLKHTLGDLAGLNAVVLGRSNIVGKPMALLLLRESTTVTIAHSRTKDLPNLCRQADILVAAVGKPLMVQSHWIKPGATIIDVGINRIDIGNGKTRLVGDVDYESAVDVAGAITPVPGGVGPMTIACLLHNTLTAACRQHKIDVPTP